uniref:NADH dehydrogenase subunit 4L n=1 Tax=Phthiridium szechuanum TaxID=2982585 RepID=UPI0022388927|nr:NADH dehydrogenase subunit 4L [Phthiridium szechuanum]UYP50984.1 NADH dehydrogenase subunit 4L [Phthiridium szechuanum]
MIIFFFEVMFLMGMLVFIKNKKHLLIMLLSLEYMVLSLFMMLYLYFSMMYNMYFLLMIFLVMSVCEGVLGLSILVSMVRMYGNDNFQVFNIL